MGVRVFLEQDDNKHKKIQIRLNSLSEFFMFLHD